MIEISQLARNQNRLSLTSTVFRNMLDLILLIIWNCNFISFQYKCMEYHIISLADIVRNKNIWGVSIFILRFQKVVRLFILLQKSFRLFNIIVVWIYIPQLRTTTTAHFKVPVISHFCRFITYTSGVCKYAKTYV